MWMVVSTWLNSAILLIIYGATGVNGDLPQGYQNCLNAPENFIANDGECFFQPSLFPSGMDYTAKKGYCASTHGGQLPVLRDAEKLNGVSTLLGTINKQMCYLALEQSPGATSSADGWAWKLQNGTENPLTASAPWHIGEPNDSGGNEDAGGLFNGIPSLMDVPRTITNEAMICQVSKGFNWCLAQQPGGKVLLSDGSCVAKHPDPSTIDKNSAKTRCGPDGQLPVLREVADRNAVAAMMGSGVKVWLGLHQEGIGRTDENWYWEYRNGFRLPLLDPTWEPNSPDDYGKPVGDHDTNVQNEGLMNENGELLDSNPGSTPKSVYCQYFPPAIREECSEFGSWPGLKFQPGVGVPPVMTGLPGDGGLKKCVQLCLLDQNCFVVEYDKATGYCKVGEERVEYADETKFEEKSPGDTMKLLFPPNACFLAWLRNWPISDDFLFYTPEQSGPIRDEFLINTIREVLTPCVGELDEAWVEDFIKMWMIVFMWQIPAIILTIYGATAVIGGFDWCLAQQPGDKVLLTDGSCVAKNPDTSKTDKDDAKTRCGPDGQLPVLREVADRNAVAAMMAGIKIWLGLHQEGVGATDENWYWEYRNGFRLPLLNPTWEVNKPDDSGKAVGDPDTNIRNEGLMNGNGKLQDSNPIGNPKTVYCQYFPPAIKGDCGEFGIWPGLKFQPGVGGVPVMAGLLVDRGLEKCAQLCLLDQNCFVVEYDKESEIQTLMESKPVEIAQGLISATGYCKVGEERVEEADGTKFQEKSPGDTMDVYQLGKS